MDKTEKGREKSFEKFESNFSAVFEDLELQSYADKFLAILILYGNEAMSEMLETVLRLLMHRTILYEGGLLFLSKIF